MKTNITNIIKHPHCKGLFYEIDNTGNIKEIEIDELKANANNYTGNAKKQAEMLLSDWDYDERQDQTRKELWEHCKSIAEKLDAIANGSFVKCPHCAELIKDIDDYTDDDGNIKCPECDETFEENDTEQYTFYDYFEDCLDITYTVDSNREYQGVCVCVAWGGPNIYIDTNTKQVEAYWGL